MNTLSVKLVGTDQPSLLGNVAGVQGNAEGAVVLVDFPATSGEPRLQVGQMCSLRFEGGHLTAAITVSGRTVMQGRGDDGFKFEFQVEEQTKNALMSERNRREAVRVKPGTESPVYLTVRSPKREFLARTEVHDISTGGLSILVTPEHEPKMYPFWELDIALELPGGEAPVEFTSQVRQRRLTGSSIGYGLSFDAERTPDFETKRKLVHAYVLERQREILSQRANVKRAG